jgi:hypothetical protein
MSKFQEREYKSVLCGDLIGKGSAREVYHARLNADYVVKIETRVRSFQNIAEHEIWSYVQGGPLEKWFAPCLSISHAGTILLQRKVEPLRQHELPKKLPALLGDLKIENFGLLNGKLVCCDYGTGVFAIRTASQRMIKADWR